MIFQTVVASWCSYETMFQSESASLDPEIQILEGIYIELMHEPLETANCDREGSAVAEGEP